jgi:hypothetical protein
MISQGRFLAFLAFLAPFEIFAVPKTAVADDETGNRGGKQHAASLQLGIEMRKFFGHSIHVRLRRIFPEARP